MVLDNTGGHELDISLPGLLFGFLPPRSTSKYQPLDLGLISHCKIHYRSKLLRCSIHMMEARIAEQENYTADTGRGKWGVCEGQLPHFADAMEMFNEACRALSRTTVFCCWTKSSCLHPQHVNIANNVTSQQTGATGELINLTNNHGASISNSNASGISVTSDKNSGLIFAALAQHKYLDCPRSP